MTKSLSAYEKYRDQLQKFANFAPASIPSGIAGIGGRISRGNNLSSDEEVMGGGASPTSSPMHPSGRKQVDNPVAGGLDGPRKKSKADILNQAEEDARNSLRNVQVEMIQPKTRSRMSSFESREAKNNLSSLIVNEGKGPR